MKCERKLATKTMKNAKLHNNMEYQLNQFDEDGQLAPALYSPGLNQINQLLQLVKNGTTVLNLVSKDFLQTSLPLLISILYAKEGI